MSISGSCFIPGRPIPEGSTRAYQRGNHVAITHANATTLRPWRADVAAAVRASVGPTIQIPTGPVAVAVAFVMPRRAAEPKRRHDPHTRKPDLDKLVRGVLDAMTGIAFTDDAQVTTIEASKTTAKPGEQPGAWLGWRLV